MDFMGCRTYYRTVGECRDGRKPLLLLHGGPGSTHNYLEVLDPLAEEGRMLVYYDQVGCGLSPAPGRKDLFNRETWIKELISLREHLGLDEIHLLGHSWGGMMLLEYVCRYPHPGLKSLISPALYPPPCCGARSSTAWQRNFRRT